MKFTKYHGAGNDFILVDARGRDVSWDGLARQMCVRHFGVGADGLIVVAADKPRVKMRMFNPDGSEAEACGNGLRCFAKHIIDTGIVKGDRFVVETIGGLREVIVFRDGMGKVNEVEVSMGVPRFDPAEIPVDISGRSGPLLGFPVEVRDRTLCVDLVSMGNPHAVMFMQEDPAEFCLSAVGPLMERHALFPSRINFEIARVRGNQDVDVRVWERGAGETLACGSGACAVGVAAKLHGYCGERTRIHLPGGVLTVTWPCRGSEVWLRGPVGQVYTGDWPD